METTTTTAQATPTAADVKAPEVVETQTQATAEGTPVEATAKVEGEQGAAVADAKKEETPEKVVPEKYELKAPEGSHLDAQALERISLEAKEKKMSQEEAQALLDREHKTVSDFKQKQQDDLKRETEAWVNTLKDDKDFGGQNYTKNVEHAHRALKKYGSPAFVDLLEKTGLGNQPDLVRMLSAVGREMGEDEAVIATKHVEPTGDLADRIYGNSK